MGNQVAYLLKKRAFLPLFLTQFFGAFNDNAYKLSMVTLISYHLSATQAQSEYYQALAGALFILPFFLFSATAGQLADKYNKAVMTRWVKVLEMVLMGIGSYALYYGNITLMLLVLTGMGVHSTFFGPIKYAILPDHLLREQLLGATALIGASTFMAILLGTTLGALAIGTTTTHVGYALIITNLVALLGFISSLFIPAARSSSRDLVVDWHLWRATKVMMVDAIHNPRIFPAIFAISWFWLIGAVMLTKLPDYVHFVLGANTSVFALFLALFSIGVALGSIAINRLLSGEITLRYVPLAMLFLSFFAIDLYFASPYLASDAPLLSFLQFFSKLGSLRIVIDFFLFSFCGGLFAVPLYTYLQISSEEGSRSRTIAANNIMNALFMVIGTIFVIILLHFNSSIVLVFLILGVLNALAAMTVWFLTRRAGV